MIRYSLAVHQALTLYESQFREVRPYIDPNHRSAGGNPGDCYTDLAFDTADPDHALSTGTTHPPPMPPTATDTSRTPPTSVGSAGILPWGVRVDEYPDT
ncbi:hypothetical protein [Nocardia sienata]|uniref:hypothetical protein n=1 Tax=Nocardia sienata TaxID=248552 RepID=UPI0007A497F0|nr:hypothetical protein [Nocardia sienata]